MKYYLVAGEASGDLHASNLMKSLKMIDPKADFRFFGGDLMAQSGGTLVKHYRELAFMGVVPVLLNLKTILRNLEICKNDISRYQPDVIILIDYPGFNLKVAKYIHSELKIPVYYYISPKLWAWKKYRIKSIKKYIDKMLCILPFEVEFYKKYDCQVEYVGNPCVDAVEYRSDKEESFSDFIKVNQLDNKPVIAILAGSRKQEIKDNLPSMLEGASLFSDYQMVIAGAPGISQEEYRPYLLKYHANVIFGQTYRILQQSQVALVTSGTATLETSLLKIPQVVCYRTPVKYLVSFIFDHFFTTPYISLVNLIAGKTVVKELFGKYFSMQSIRTELELLLINSDYRKQMQENYEEIIRILGKPGASEQAASAIYTALKR